MWPSRIRARIVKKVIGVVSGKGGVGKSMVTALLAVGARRMGLETAVLDADITGPSIPKAFGLKDKAYGSEDGHIPGSDQDRHKGDVVESAAGNDTDPVVWRGR